VAHDLSSGRPGDAREARPARRCRRFLGDLAAGAFSVEPVAAADWLRIAELVASYRVLPLGTVDASVVTAAERLGVQEIATVDRRHLSVVRPSHGAAFTLVP
jgi:predicted nucleic acid-binding protein